MNPSITNDAAIQVWELRREHAAACAAITDRVEALSDPDRGGALQAPERHGLALAWWGVWAAVGLLLVLVIAPAFRGAWRFWRE